MINFSFIKNLQCCFLLDGNFFNIDFGEIHLAKSVAESGFDHKNLIGLQPGPKSIYINAVMDNTNPILSRAQPDYQVLCEITDGY